MNNLITIQDLFIVPFLLVAVFLVGTRVKNKHIQEEPYYKYFTWGLWAKIVAGLAFAAIYLFYYGGGDTVYYFHGSQCIVNMLGKDIPTFFKLLAGNHSDEIKSMFDQHTGYPYFFRDPNTFSVCRFNVIFYLLSFGSYVGTTILFDLALYFVVWRFYKMLISYFKGNEKYLAFALLFIPSVAFWSSGILKDGWTYIGILGIYVSFYHVFFTHKKILFNLMVFLFWSYIVFSIRPFMFYLAFASVLIWLAFSAMKAIKSNFIRVIVFPFIALLFWTFGTITLAKTGTMANSRYESVDAMLETAWIIQDDLKKDYYGGNSFNIGEFEPTLPGILKMAPKAIISGIFRPFIWEGEGFLTKFSGLENVVLMILLTYAFIETGFFKTIKGILQNPLLLSLAVFAVTFAFLVGLTTANFGALVRYRIPVLTFIIIPLFVSLQHIETV